MNRFEEQEEVLKDLKKWPIDFLASEMVKITKYLHDMRIELFNRIRANPGICYRQRGGAGWIAYIDRQAVAETVTLADLAIALNAIGLSLDMFQGH